MLRRDLTPSPPLSGGDDVGASPTGVLDLWDTASWSQELTDPLGTDALAKQENTVLSYQDMLGEAALLPSEGLEDVATDDKEEGLLQMGGSAWSDACLAAVQLSMDGTTIGGKMSSAEGGERNSADQSEEETPPLGEHEALLSTVNFSMEAPTEPMEDGINLGDETRQTFPLKLDAPSLGAPLHKGEDAAEQTPQSPVSEQTEDTNIGITDLANLEVIGLDNDDPLSVLDHDFSPDDLSTGSGDPTGGVDDPFDEEDYCGWLAEDI